MFSFDSRVRYSECDSDFNMTVASVVNYLQDCTTFHSYELGVGTESLKARNRAWLLSSWQIVIDRFPHMNEKIKIATVPYEFKGIYGLRNFIIFDENDESIVKANSVWFFYDSENGKPAKIDDIERNAYPLGDKIDMDYAPRKIDLPPMNLSAQPVPVSLSMLDTNHHVNNGQYILVAKMIMDSVKKDAGVRQIRAEYKRQALMGDIFYPKVGEKEGEFYVDLENESGESFAVIAFTIENIDKK